MQEAIIQAGGAQHQIKKGQKFKLNKIDGEVGTEVSFDVLALVGDQAKFGTPLVAGAKVVAKILDQGKDKKVTKSIYKRRKGYHKKQGHRQLITQLEVTDIKI